MGSGVCSPCRSSEMNVLFRFLLIMTIAATMEACADPYFTAAPIEAWVVDAETGQAIEGAVVTANWQLVGFGFDTGGRKLGQLEVMETVTDQNGRFYFPGFTKVNISGNQLREEDPQILIFKSGYRYMRITNQYPIGKEGEQGAHRKSPIVGQRLKMQRASDDVKQYAQNLAFFSDYLGTIAENSGPVRTPKMLRALFCERQRIRKLDPTVSSIPIPRVNKPEINCESK